MLKIKNDVDLKELEKFGFIESFGKHSISIDNKEQNERLFQIPKYRDFVFLTYYDDTREITLEAINKEITYRQDYEVWKKEGSDLVDLVEKYCKYKDKYEAIDLFKEIDKEYVIKKKKVEG